LKKPWLLISLASILLSLIPAQQSFAGGEDLEGTKAPADDGYVVFEANPNFMHSFSQPSLLGKELASDGSHKSLAICKSMDDPACNKANYFFAQSLFDFCASPTESNCIDSIYAEKQDGTKLDVGIVSKFPDKRPQDYVGDSKLNLPSGGQTTLVSIPGASHSGGDRYLALVNPSGWLDRRKDQNNSKFTFKLETALYAVSVKTGNFQVGSTSTKLSEYPDNYLRSSVYGGESSCLINGATQCAQAVEMPKDIRFGIKLRLSYEIENWFGGRLATPNISVSSSVKNQNLIDISAFPVNVPLVSRTIDIRNLPQSIIDFDARQYKKVPGNSGKSGLEKYRDNPVGNFVIRTSLNMSQYYMDQFTQLLEIFDDKATALPTMWNYSSITSESQWNDCLKNSKSLAGFVLSNATQYIDGPPTYNAKDNTLDYKVAAPHFTPEGEVFKGSYDLVMSSKVARCFYNFSNAPIGASVSVQTDRGVQNVATTVVNEKNGLLYITAKNFTFSSPTLKIKLTQKKNQKYTITCKKGTVSKPVTGTAPKCPKGFKKVA
jgi:hypothetical protein